MKFWNKFNISSSCQFGIRENHSTALATTHLREYILDPKELDNTLNVFTLNHNILLYKLKQYGFR